MWRPVFILLVALTGLATCNPIGRQVGLSADVSVTAINKTAVCVVDGILYTEGQHLPTADPCEECQCRPPGFACEAVQCSVKPGCQGFQEEGQCCPTYSCGCQKDGVEIPEGETVNDPRNPCESCVCKGGEFVCTVESCLWRDDCMGRYTPGICCPSYDHCPVTDSAGEASAVDQGQQEGEESTVAPDPQTPAIREGGEGERPTETPEVNEGVTQSNESETEANETPAEANEAVNEASSDAGQEFVETQTETNNEVQSEGNEEYTQASVRQSETETDVTEIPEYTTETPEQVNLKLDETQTETSESATEVSEAATNQADAEIETRANEAQNEESGNTETPVEENEAETTTLSPAGDTEVLNKGDEVLTQMLPQASNIQPQIVDAPYRDKRNSY
ncbi:von Willebrand factor C and EGF domain-containing protein-like [Scylla paramamosain]|uniref:von Willebrand factor C and EGF domain-containing protein-like n=1 Tax=Scylla paramamosain TaxID=85552 RepID=UPI00308365D3